MTIDEAIKRFKDNAEYERSNGSLQSCLEFRKLVEWLAELKKLKEQIEPYENCTSKQTVKEQMIKYGFHAPDMTVTEFVEDVLPSVQPEQRIDWTCIDKLKAKSYSESEYGVPEFDANKVIQLSDVIDIIKDYCGAKMEEGE